MTDTDDPSTVERSKVEVTAVEWSGGWELHIADEGVTQVESLEDAAAQVRDYLEVLHEADFSGVEVMVTLLERRLEAAGARLTEADAERDAAMADLTILARQADGILPVARVAALGRVSRPTVYKLQGKK